jgi:hypothetical protein
VTVSLGCLLHICSNGIMVVLIMVYSYMVQADIADNGTLRVALDYALHLFTLFLHLALYSIPSIRHLSAEQAYILSH